MKKDDQISCKLCKSKFVPEKDQKDAHWATNWCTGENGKLCPPCHEVAEELGAVSSTPLPLGVCPFGSDILKKSRSVSKKDWEKRRKSESWQTWVAENHPDWL